jgi:ribosomal protein L11 methyltransferase
MSFAEIRIYSSGIPDTEKDIIIAYLLNLGFDSFLEEEGILKAYIPAGSYTDDYPGMIRFFLNQRNLDPRVEFSLIPLQNWNSEWEKNYQPVIVDGICAVKASFHKLPEYTWNIIIDPEMSFGTGHHETTLMMIKHVLQTNPEAKDVLDMGCGTGVLGILAALMGARSVTAIDIDGQACENAINNFYKNNIHKGFSVLKGEVELIYNRSFDLILANINKNIILKDINNYTEALKPYGTLIISGILIDDKDKIVESAEKTGLKYCSSHCENKWLSIKFTK